jgi:hypothetical protein
MFIYLLGVDPLVVRHHLDSTRLLGLLNTNTGSTASRGWYNFDG